MKSSAFLVLKSPASGCPAQAPVPVPVPVPEPSVATAERSVSFKEDNQGGIVYRKVSKDDEQNRVVTIRSQVRRTPSDANEELRDAIVETSFLSPVSGAAVQERDVIRSRRKITPRGSNYYQRTTQRTRLVRDKEGSDFVEHDVCVESDNTSMGQGLSWGNKTVTKVTLDKPSGDLPPALDQLASLPQLEAAKRGGGGGAGGGPGGRMDLSKASSGYGSVSGSEDDDKDLSPTPGAPEIVHTLTDLTATEGQAATLECSLTAQPPPQITWYQGDRKLDVTSSSDQFTAHYDAATGRATLTLHDVVVEDGGKYTCVGRNEWGEASTKATLRVEPSSNSQSTVAPMFLNKLRDHTLNEGDELVLECDVIGSPEPSVHWLRDGLDLPDSLSFESRYDGRTARLQVERLAVGEEGVFQCRARNPAGSASVDCRVHVQKRRTAPTFTTPLQDVTSEPGKHVILKCDVSGTPAPSVCWRRNGLMVGESPDFVQSLKQEGQACLEVLGLRDKHEGLYECVATNEVGSATCSCRLTLAVSTANADATKKPHQQTPTATTPTTTTTKTTNTTASTAAEPPLPVVRRRTFKKLSEPQHSEVITAVLQSAAGKRNGAGGPGAVQRAQSFSPASSSSSSTQAAASRPPGPLRAFSAAVGAAPGEGRRLEEGDAGVGEEEGGGAPRNRYTVQWKDSQGKVHSDPGDASVSTSTSSSAAPSTGSSSARELPPRGGPASSTSSSSLQDVRSSASRPLKTQSFRHSRAGPSPERGPTEDRAPRPPSSKGGRDDAAPSSAQERGGGKTLSSSSSSSSSASSPSPRSMVSQLRAQFAKLEEEGGGGGGGGGGGLRRWHSMPLKQERPAVVKRGTSQLAAEDSRSTSSVTAPTTTTTMSSYDHIDDEEELHKMMNAAESFDERKKIRTRLREIREKQRDGTTTVTKKTESSSVKQSTGFGGVQYGASRAPELNTKELRTQLGSGSGSGGSSGSISVKTEAWSSRDGLIHKGQKTETWGAKPQGARGAMAAFKQMDAATSPTGPKPNGLVTVSLAKKAAHTMRRNAVAIKEEILRFVKVNVKDYKNIEVTNFSTSWNDGLAFCALIHHFYPDAFDYSQLDPKNRRYNFELAFNTAEKMADIAPLLDVEDMVKMKTPDWKCVFTYVQSFYRHLRDHENNKAKAPAEA